MPERAPDPALPDPGEESADEAVLARLLGEPPRDELPTIVPLMTDAIVDNPFQPRQAEDDPDLEELAESIRCHGLLQPLVVAQIEPLGTHDELVGLHKYVLVAGSRRLRAARLLGLVEVPCMIRQLPAPEGQVAWPPALAALALVENLQRRRLRHQAIAAAIGELRARFGLSLRLVGRLCGKSHVWVQLYERARRFPPLLEAMDHGAVSLRQAGALLASLESGALQPEALLQPPSAEASATVRTSAPAAVSPAPASPAPAAARWLARASRVHRAIAQLEPALGRASARLDPAARAELRTTLETAAALLQRCLQTLDPARPA